MIYKVRALVIYKVRVLVIYKVRESDDLSTTRVAVCSAQYW